MLLCILMKNILFLLVVVLHPLYVLGQQDSVPKVNELYHWDMVEGLIATKTVDTTLNKFHKSSLTFSEGFISLGNLGSPAYHFEGLNNQNWSISPQDVFQAYQSKGIKNIFTKTPYTKLFYSNGTNEEQYLTVQHGQRITNNLWVTAGLNKINSKGFYENQSTDNTLGSVSGYYQTKNRRFLQSIDYRFTRFSVLENGGIEDREGFIKGVRDRDNLDVRLTDASNLLRRHSIGSITMFGLSKLDSNNTDNFGYLVNDLSIGNEKGNFKDLNPDSLWYNQFGIMVGDSLSDVVMYDELINELGWQNYQPWSDTLPVMLNVALGYEGGRVDQNNNRSYLNSGYGKIGISYRGSVI